MGMVTGSCRGERVATLLLISWLLSSAPAVAQQAAPRVFSDPTAQVPATPSTTPVPGTKTTLAGHAAVESIQLTQPTKARLQARKSSYSVTVKSAEWVDTHLMVAPGDTVTFTAKGDVTLADGRKINPDGSARGWKDLLRQFPDNSSPTGSLVGRIGTDAASVPFAVGAGKSLQVVSSGEMFLCINASSDLTPDGSYSVEMKLSHQTAQAKAETTQETAVASTLSPSLFANIPRRVEDQAKDPGDMVNFAIVGTEDQVTQAFQNAGWVTVDTTKEDAVVHGLLATLQHKAYVEMPMSTLYLFGRAQDLSYARADPIKVAAERHHLRVWRSEQTVDGKPLWVGSSTHDVGFERDDRNNGITHKIDPEIDKERDFLEQSFAAAGDLQSAAYVTPDNPLRTANTATGGSFESDGRIVVLLLK